MDESAAEKNARIRARELERKVIPPLPPTFQTGVVGVSFAPTYPANLHALEQAWLNAELLGERLAVVFRRNPDNAYDANAVEVHVPALGDRGFVGHLTRPLAARLALELDAGVVWQAEVTYVKMHSDHPDRPGLDIKMWRK